VVAANDIDIPPQVHDVFGGLYLLRTMPELNRPRSERRKEERLGEGGGPGARKRKTPSGTYKTIRMKPTCSTTCSTGGRRILYVWLTDDAQAAGADPREDAIHYRDYNLAIGEGTIMSRNWTRTACAVTLAFLAPAMFAQPPRPLLSTKDALELSQRIVDLVESTAVSVPNLARASAPVQESTRQALKALKESPQLNSAYVHVPIEARSYIALSDTVPPYPFAEAAQKQFQELRMAIDRLTRTSRPVDQKETQLRTPDRDNIRRHAVANQKVWPASRISRGWYSWAIPSPTAGGSTNTSRPRLRKSGISARLPVMLGRMKDVINPAGAMPAGRHSTRFRAVSRQSDRGQPEHDGRPTLQRIQPLSRRCCR
jgi:hypothetical protein